MLFGLVDQEGVLLDDYGNEGISRQLTMARPSVSGQPTTRKSDRCRVASKWCNGRPSANKKRTLAISGFHTNYSRSCRYHGVGMLTNGKYDDLTAMGSTEARQRRGRRHRALAYVFALLSVAFLSIYAFNERDGAYLFCSGVFALLAASHLSLSRTSESS